MLHNPDANQSNDFESCLSVEGIFMLNGACLWQSQAVGISGAILLLVLCDAYALTVFLTAVYVASEHYRSKELEITIHSSVCGWPASCSTLSVPWNQMLMCNPTEHILSCFYLPRGYSFHTRLQVLHRDYISLPFINLFINLLWSLGTNT